MPPTLFESFRARGLVAPDYAGRGLVNLAASMLDMLGVRTDADPPPLRDLDPALTRGVRQVVVVLADGLGLRQLRELAAAGDVPFLASLLERAERRDHAQLLELVTIFPSTTVAAITTLNTATTPQEHGNIAYFTWLEEFGQVAQMLRWGPATSRRGSFFEDRARDPTTYVRARSVHSRIRAAGGASYVIEPEVFRTEAMTRMHAADATYCGYHLASSMGVRLRDLLERRPAGDVPTYIYAYWAGIDTVAHLHGPRSPEHATEAALFDVDLARAIARRPPGDTLVLLTADHGHAFTNPDRQIDLLGDAELRALLRNPLAGEPRAIFLHTDHADRAKAHLDRRHPDAFFFIDREEAIAAGLFGRGDPEVIRRRVGEVIALLTDDRGASIMRVDGQVFRHRGSHGGLTPDEMRIPVLAWRA